MMLYYRGGFKLHFSVLHLFGMFENRNFEQIRGSGVTDEEEGQGTNAPPDSLDLCLFLEIGPLNSASFAF